MKEEDEYSEDAEEDSYSLLIQLVEKIPAIYIKSSKGSDKRVIDNGWIHIAESMSQSSSIYSVDDCQKMWTTLKRKWSRERKKLNQPPDGSSSFSHKPIWSLYHPMCFLDEHVQTRRSYSTGMSKVDDELLVQLVQKFPELYTKSTKVNGHQKMEIIENGWIPIAQAMNQSIDACQMQWEKLKKKWTQERKFRKEAHGYRSTVSHREEWPLYQAMQFLEPHIHIRRCFKPSTTKTKAKQTQNAVGLFGPIINLGMIPNGINQSDASPSNSLGLLSGNVETSSAQVDMGLPFAPEVVLSTKSSFQSEEIDHNYHQNQMKPPTTRGERRIFPKPEAIPMDGDEGFCHDIMYIFRQINGRKRKLQCKQRILSILEEYVVDSD